MCPSALKVNPNAYGSHAEVMRTARKRKSMGIAMAIVATNKLSLQPRSIETEGTREKANIAVKSAVPNSPGPDTAILLFADIVMGSPFSPVGGIPAFETAPKLRRGHIAAETAM